MVHSMSRDVNTGRLIIEQSFFKELTMEDSDDVSRKGE